MGLVLGFLALLFLFSGMPIAFALGAVSVLVTVIFIGPTQLNMLAELLYSGTDNFGLLAIPLFIFMGIIVASTRAGTDLYECFNKWLHKVPGGLGMANIVSCAVFAALTGSSQLLLQQSGPPGYRN